MKIIDFLKRIFCKPRDVPPIVVPQKPVVIPKQPNPLAYKRLPKCPSELKTSYNEQVAKREALKLQMRAYKCMFCPHWHITHKKNKLRMH